MRQTLEKRFIKEQRMAISSSPASPDGALGGENGPNFWSLRQSNAEGLYSAQQSPRFLLLTNLSCWGTREVL